MPHLPPAQHETSKRDSPHDTRIKVKQLKCLIFEFKHWHVNDSSQSNQELTTWFLNLSLDESIDNKKYKVFSSNPQPREAQLDDQKGQEKLKKII
jgi:hypothetical protein